MSDLQTHLNAVRRGWRQTELLKGLALLAADAVVALLALIALDATYHLPGLARAALLLAGFGAVAAIGALGMARPLRRRLQDDDIALYVEGRYPQLQGTLVSAVEYVRRPSHPSLSPQGRGRNGGQLQDELVDALMVDCLERAAQIDFQRVIDKRRLARRAVAAGVLGAFFLGAVAVKPHFFGHELQRVLAPWRRLPLSEDELQAERQRRLAEEEQRRLLEEAARASQPIKVEFSVMPGDAELERGGSLRVAASVNHLAGPLDLRFRSSGGEWRALPMEEDSARPESFTQVLRDISENLEYRVAMKEHESSSFKVTVYDPATVKELRLVYRFPAYTGMNERTVTGLDGGIEALENTVVGVTLVATGPLSAGSLLLDNGKTISMQPAGNEVTGSLTVKADGEYGVRADDTHKKPLPFPARFPIRMLKDEPPKVELVYPTMDAEVHPLEEVVFSAKAEDTVGLKEVRLHYYFNTGKEEILRLPCTAPGHVVTEELAEFVVELEKRPNTKTGDTVIYHIEAEDTKGQVTATDVYTASVRPWETFAAYGYHPVMAPHGYAGPALLNVLGAAWELHGKRGTLPKDKFIKESEKIGRALEEQP